MFVLSVGPTNYIFHTSVSQYSLFVLKVPLNTNKPNQTLSCIKIPLYMWTRLGCQMRKRTMLKLLNLLCPSSRKRILLETFKFIIY